MTGPALLASSNSRTTSMHPAHSGRLLAFVHSASSAFKHTLPPLRCASFRYEDNFDAVNNVTIMSVPSDKGSIDGYGAPEKFLESVSYLFGKQVFSGMYLDHGVGCCNGEGLTGQPHCVIYAELVVLASRVEALQHFTLALCDGEPQYSTPGSALLFCCIERATFKMVMRCGPAAIHGTCTFPVALRCLASADRLDFLGEECTGPLPSSKYGLCPCPPPNPLSVSCRPDSV